MDISVSSRHVEVSPALRDAVVEKIGRVDRYLEGMDRADVHFSAERNPRIEQREICEVTISGGGHVVRAKVAAADQFAAVDAGRVHGLKGAPQVADGEEIEEARLVKVKRFAVKPMTVDEAILQMELLGHSFFFFENAESATAAVVYRRADGDIGMIEAIP
jgi:ribosome hibernation promoting factor